MWHEPELAEPRPGVTGVPMETLPEVSRKRKRASEGIASPTPSTHHNQTEEIPLSETRGVSPSSDATDTARELVAKELDDNLRTALTAEVSLVSDVRDAVEDGNDGRRRRSTRVTKQVNYAEEARIALGLGSPSPSPEGSPRESTPPERGQWHSSIDEKTPTKVRLSRRPAANNDNEKNKTDYASPSSSSHSSRKRNGASTPPPKSTPKSASAKSEKGPTIKIEPGMSPGGRRRTATLAFSAIGGLNFNARPGQEAAETPTGAGAGSCATTNGPNAHENNDWCSSCGGTGRFLCCENCPRSFHFVCVDPPVDEDSLPDGAWFCRQCDTRMQPPVPYRKSLFSDLLNQLERRNPRQFRLPQGIRTRFEGVGTADNGDYIDENQLPPKKPRDPDDFLKLENANGDTILCYKCGNSALKGAMATCAKCTAPWHVDCLDPPQYSIPNYWVCPNHAENAARLPRRVKKPNVVDVFLKRGQHNNGCIEVQDDSDQEDIVRDIPFFGIHDTATGVAAPIPKHRMKTFEGNDGVVYRIPARSIKLDFIDLIHQRAQEPYIETPTSQLLVALDELATKPDPERQAVRDLMYLKLQESPSVSAAQARENLEALLDVATDENNKLQTAALLKLIEIKGRDKLLEFLTS